MLELCKKFFFRCWLIKVCFYLHCVTYSVDKLTLHKSTEREPGNEYNLISPSSAPTRKILAML